MNKELLRPCELFEQIISQLEQDHVFLAIRGHDIYLIQSNTFQKHRIKIGELESLKAQKYNQSCSVDWNQDFKDYWAGVSKEDKHE